MTTAPNKIDSLYELASRKIPEPLLRNMACRGDDLSVILETANQIASNITVRGHIRDAGGPASFTVMFDDENHSKIRIDSIDVPEFWCRFDLDTGEISGQICCHERRKCWKDCYVARPHGFPLIYSPYDNDVLLLYDSGLVASIQKDPDIRLGPRRGSCRHTTRSYDNYYRVECIYHLSNWLEIHFDDK